MSFENGPIEIDLSQENAWNTIDDSLLSPEEKRILAEQYKEESDAIIYLTQEELDTLKFIISEDVSASHEADFHEFIDEQSSEGFGIQDILDSELQNPELIGELSALEDIANEGLFGSEGVLSSLGLSEYASSTTRTGCILALLQIHRDNPEASVEENAANVLEGLSLLQSLINETIEGPGGAIPKLTISNLGDTNGIFNNPEQSKDLFLGIINGEYTAENLETLIEEQNDTERNIDIENISQNFHDLLSEIISQGEERNDEEGSISGEEPQIPDGAIDAANESGAEIGSEHWLVALFNAIREILGSLTEYGFITAPENNETSEIGVEAEQEATEVAPTNTERAKQLFRERITEGSITSFDIGALQTLFPEEGELSAQALRIIEIIDNLPDTEGQTSFEEKFENIFVAQRDDDRPRIEYFIEAGGERVFDSEADTANKLLGVLNAYTLYRNTGGGVSYSEYFQRL